MRLDALEGRTVLFAYPRTGTPGEAPPGGEERWDAIPGAEPVDDFAARLRTGIESIATAHPDGRVRSGGRRR